MYYRCERAAWLHEVHQCVVEIYMYSEGLASVQLILSLLAVDDGGVRRDLHFGRPLYLKGQPCWPIHRLTWASLVVFFRMDIWDFPLRVALTAFLLGPSVSISTLGNVHGLCERFGTINIKRAPSYTKELYKKSCPVKIWLPFIANTLLNVALTKLWSTLVFTSNFGALNLQTT